MRIAFQRIFSKQNGLKKIANLVVENTIYFHLYFFYF